MVKLVDVKEKDKQKLWNVLQKYLYEITCYYDDKLDNDGNYRYRYFDNYFTEDNRFAKFVYVDDELAGFILVNDHSFNGDRIDYGIAEFTIFPKFRGGDVAETAFLELTKGRVGKWQLKYIKSNVRGMKFWQKVTARYNAREESCSSCNGKESIVIFEVS